MRAPLDRLTRRFLKPRSRLARAVDQRTTSKDSRLYTATAVPARKPRRPQKGAMDSGLLLG